MRTHALTTICLIALILLAGAQTNYAQMKAASPELQQADQLFQAKDWPASARAYEAIVAKDEKNGMAWFRLGYSLHSMGKFEEAIPAFQRADAVGFAPQLSKYNIACGYSMTKDKDKAFEALDKLVQSGYGQVAQLKSDTDFDNLREDPRFNEVLTKADRNARPCAYKPESRQFDFWKGEWDVKNPQGALVGTSSVQLILGDCVIFENWTGRGGAIGKSFNIYNTAKGKWQQTWVDNSGSVLELFGDFKDNQMRLQGESLAPDGNKLSNRLTFFNQGPDQVRQLWEQSSDGGKTWTVAFDGTYTRRKE